MVYSSCTASHSIEEPEGAQVAIEEGESHDIKQDLVQQTRRESLRTRDGKFAWREQEVKQYAGRPLLRTERVQLPPAQPQREEAGSGHEERDRDSPMLSSSAQFQRLFSTTAHEAAKPFAQLRVVSLPVPSPASISAPRARPHATPPPLKRAKQRQHQQPQPQHQHLHQHQPKQKPKQRALKSRSVG